MLVGHRSNSYVDAFYPSTRAITLSDNVDRKRDPSFWAVAAHELGHALVYRKNSIIHWPLTIARWVQSSTAMVSRALILGNVLYANPRINELAFLLLTIGLFAYLLVLVDELLASSVAIYLLAKDRRVDRSGLVGAITALAAAFMTYVGGFTGQVILLLQRDFIVRQIAEHRHFTPGPPITVGPFALVALLSSLLIALSVRSIVRTLRKRDFKSTGESTRFEHGSIGDELARGTVGVIILWLVWDRQGSETYALLCIGGLLASRVVVGIAEWIATVLAKLVVMLLVVLVAWWLIIIVLFVWALIAKPSGGASPFPEPPDGPESIRRKAAIEAMGLELANRPHWYLLAFQTASALLHIVFVVGVIVSFLR